MWRDELLNDVTAGALIKLKPGAYLISNTAAGSPVAAHGNLLIMPCSPTEFTPRVVGLAVFDAGGTYAVGGWDGGISWSRLDL